MLEKEQAMQELSAQNLGSEVDVALELVGQVPGVGGCEATVPYTQ